MNLDLELVSDHFLFTWSRTIGLPGIVPGVMARRQDVGLSSEQIRRMEENRRQAQQRLSNKRAAAESTSKASSQTRTVAQTAQFVSAPRRAQYGPPPAKRPVLNPGPSSHQYQHHERKIIGPPPQLMSDYVSGHRSVAAGSSVMSQGKPMESTIASTSYQRPPQTAGGSSSASSPSDGSQVDTFYSRDAGPAAVRGTGTVSSASSNQKVLLLKIC